MRQKTLVLLTFLLCSIFTNAQIPFVKNRNHISLTDWKFKKGVIYNAQQPTFNDESWEKVNVPHTYSMDAINEVGYYRGMAWYRTSITIPKNMKGQRIFIRFEGIGQESSVYANGKLIGTHIGGYSAFCYDITEAVVIGKNNQITVKVNNAPSYMRIPVNDVLFNHYGGIYRPVQIFSTPKCNISPTYYASSGVFVELKKIEGDLAQIEVRTHISNKTDVSMAKLAYNVLNADSESVAKSSKDISTKGDTVISEIITINKPILWNGRINPYLYSIDIELICDKSVDKVNQTFGLRTFEVNPSKGMFLNGKPYRVNGVCMHQEWKQVGPALTPEHHKKDMELVDEIGATGLRLSHYQHSDITYQLANKIGLMVWAEIPFVHDYSGREGKNAEQQLTELILQNYNHPSIYVWGLWNEVRAWTNPDEACVSITKNLNDLANKLDPTRLTTSASDRDMKAPMTKLSNLQAWNKYYGWYYGKYKDMATWLDTERKAYPDIALGISEYGIGGNIYQQDTSKLEKPVGNYFPEPEQTRYHEITWEIIKDRPFVWGSFIWNMFDFSVAGWNRGGIKNLNHKGLVTFDREVKKDAFYFYKANWSKEPVLYIAELRNTERKIASTQVKVFTNLEKVTLILNGRKIGTLRQSGDINSIVFENITLKKGENIVEVLSKKGKETFHHKAIWNLL